MLINNKKGNRNNDSTSRKKLSIVSPSKRPLTTGKKDNNDTSVVYHTPLGIK